jgi:hypothetical protein
MRVLFLFLACFAWLKSVQAWPGQEQEPQRAVNLASIERRMQAVYEQVGPAIVKFAYGKDPELPLGNGVIVTADGPWLPVAPLTPLSGTTYWPSA